MYSDLYSYSSPYSYGYDYGSSLGSSSSSPEAIVGGFLAILLFVILFAAVVSILVYVARWKLFAKAGKKPWEALIPVHSDIIEMELGGIETYWYFLNLAVCVPFVGWIAPIVLSFWKNISLAKSFGKGSGFGVLMTFFPYVCYPILGFGNAQYVGPQVGNVPPTQPQQPPVQPVDPNMNNNNQNQ